MLSTWEDSTFVGKLISMGCLRVLLCIFLPPLAVLDKGCGTVLLIAVLTVFGWVPGALGALIICTRNQPPKEKKAKRGFFT